MRMWSDYTLPQIGSRGGPSTVTGTLRGRKFVNSERIIASPDVSSDPYSFFSHTFYSIILGFVSFFLQAATLKPSSTF